MPVDAQNFWDAVKKHPDRFYIIHYSSQSLYDEGVDGLSPRITSIVIMHYATRQTVSFALHAVAESITISKDGVESHYNDIEKELLKRFFDFLRDRREKYWIHWNMRNLEAVRAFHAAAMAAGGSDDGAPGVRPQYHADYYGAFVRDPDGHRIEAVCHAPEAPMVITKC